MTKTIFVTNLNETKFIKISCKHCGYAMNLPLKIPDEIVYQNPNGICVTLMLAANYIMYLYSHGYFKKNCITTAFTLTSRIGRL